MVGEEVEFVERSGSGGSARGESRGERDQAREELVGVDRW